MVLQDNMVLNTVNTMCKEPLKIHLVLECSCTTTHYVITFMLFCSCHPRFVEHSCLLIGLTRIAMKRDWSSLAQESALFSLWVSLHLPFNSIDLLCFKLYLRLHCIHQNMISGRLLNFIIANFSYDREWNGTSVQCCRSLECLTKVIPLTIKLSPLALE